MSVSLARRVGCCKENFSDSCRAGERVYALRGDGVVRDRPCKAGGRFKPGKEAANSAPYQKKTRKIWQKILADFSRFVLN